MFLNHTLIVSCYRCLYVILPLCHFPPPPNTTQCGNSAWISSHYYHSCHFHSVRFFQSEELLFVFTATVTDSAAMQPDSEFNLTELLCVLKLTHKLQLARTHKTHQLLILYVFSHLLMAVKKHILTNIQFWKHTIDSQSLLVKRQTRSLQKISRNNTMLCIFLTTHNFFRLCFNAVFLEALIASSSCFFKKFYLNFGSIPFL